MIGGGSATDIRSVGEYADRLGVRLTVRESSNVIDLDWLGRRPFAPAGAGALVLRALCNYADDAGRSVRLDVLAGRDRLIAFYSNFGFTILHHALNDSDTNEMVRMPAQ